MDTPLPFFYYDILSRIIAGGVTLAVLATLRAKFLGSWLSFLGGVQGWKTVGVPLILGALCYSIGVVYEALDYSLMRWLVFSADEKAFVSAWQTHCDGTGKEALERRTRKELHCLRFKLWDALVYKAGSDPGIGSAFAHSHRFQAEYKMFLHLIYPAIIMSVLSFVDSSCVVGLLSMGSVLVLCLLSHLRNQRRWVQTLNTCRQLGRLIETSADSCFRLGRPISNEE